MQTACLFNHFPLNINADEVRLEGTADRLFTGRHHCHNSNKRLLSHTYMTTDSLNQGFTMLQLADSSTRVARDNTSAHWLLDCSSI